MVFWTNWSFSRHCIKVYNTFCSLVKFNCPVQDIAHGMWATMLTIDLITLLMDVDNIALANNVANLETELWSVWGKGRRWGCLFFQIFLPLPVSTSIFILIKPQNTALSDILISSTYWFYFGVSCCMCGHVVDRAKFYLTGNWAKLSNHSTFVWSNKVKRTSKLFPHLYKIKVSRKECVFSYQ